MAKIFGLSGRITGRKGDAVFAVRSGEQIVRQYNPIVANPKTPAQVDSRLKLKFSSQLGMVFSNVIAMKKNGAQSVRNVFQQVNFPNIEVADSTSGRKASIDMTAIKLTKSARFMPGVVAEKENDTVTAHLAGSMAGIFDKVVYVVANITENGELRVLGSEVCETPGATGDFELELSRSTAAWNSGAMYVYAYGVTAGTEKGSVKLDEINGDAAHDIAQMFSENVVSEADLILSDTSAAKVDEI